MDLSHVRPSAPKPQLGVNFGLQPDGAPLVSLVFGGVSVAMATAQAREFAGLLLSCAEGAEAAALLVASARARWSVDLPIPDALAIVLAWRNRVTSAAPAVNVEPV